MKLITITLLLSLGNAAIAKNIFDKMDKETAVTTGIYKLSQDEQEALIKWLGSTKKEIIKKDKVKNMGFSQKITGDREEISSFIVNVVKSNNGKKIYTLENAQQWKQLDSSSLFIPKSKTNPAVTIKPKSMGSWSLYVDGFSRNVKVKRIK